MNVEQKSRNINMRHIVLPLRVISGLSALVFVLAFCYEIFISYNPQALQKWVLSAVMFILSIWAFIEIHPVYTSIHSVIVKRLRYLLMIQCGVAGLYPLIRFLFLKYIPQNQVSFYEYDTGFRWIILILYSAIFIAIIDLIISIFSLNEKNKVEVLEFQNEELTATLIKANKTAATGALSAAIAHELNQPLGASNLNIRFLKIKLEQGLLTTEVGKEVIDSLEKDNKRASIIVDTLRSIFSPKELDTNKVHLGALILKVLEIANPSLTSKGIQIQVQIDEGLFINANQGDIEQVILNLLNNSIQAFERFKVKEQRISIEARSIESLVELTLSDNATGVLPEFQKHLFELLSTTKKEGMGLGLWLCKYILTRHEGNIYYEDAQGGGAKFTIRLPSVVEKA